MKIFNKLLVGVVMLFVMSCTEGFEEMNINPNQPAVATSGQLLAAAQSQYADAIGDEWNNARMGMYYAQYWSSTYYAEESYYQIRENVNQAMWTQFYANVLRELVEAQKIDNESKLPGYEYRIAIAEIMKQLTFHTLSDIYGGPIPYSEAVTEDNYVPKYESGPDVYMGILNSLEQQVEILKPGQGGNAYSEGGDIIYGGSITNWIKFANSLRMRVALRMIDAKPAEAAAAIAKSLDPANGGVISSNGESARFKWITGAPNNNPLAEAWKTRIDFSVSKTLVDALKGKVDTLAVGVDTIPQDPRLGVYAEPLRTLEGGRLVPILDANDQLQYVGEVYGQRAGAASSNGATEKVSLPGQYVIGEMAPTDILTYVEVEFMLAEIAARSLPGVVGTAEMHYVEGVRASFIQAGLTADEADAYLAEFHDEVSFADANWKDAIGYQKWVAMYGQGIQGWLERLRLDFKHPITGEAIFALPAYGSQDPTVTEVPFRMSYPVTENALNTANYQAAVQMIGGRNVKGAKQWWDVN
jgi:hypothetical protein